MSSCMTVGHEDCAPDECEVSAVYALLGRSREHVEAVVCDLDLPEDVALLDEIDARLKAWAGSKRKARRRRCS